MTEKQRSDAIEAMLTIACGVASFWVFWYVLDTRIAKICDFDCRWSAVFFQ